MSLAGASSGSSVAIVGFEGGRNMQARLLAMGLVRGARVRIIANEGQGPLLIALGESRMSIGRGMAARIMVR